MGANPNGANNTTSDPREQIMWDIYTANLAKGIDNAYKASIEAGYSESHSENITLQGWFKERKDKLKRKDMLSKAEKVLEKTLNYSTEDEDGRVRVDLLRVQTDVAKTLVTTLGKNEGYSSRQELTGKDGESLPQPLLFAITEDVSNNNSNEEDSEAETED